MRGLGGGHALHVVEPLLRVQRARSRGRRARTVTVARLGGVVRAARVARRRRSAARSRRPGSASPGWTSADVLDRPGGDRGDAEDRDAEAGVRQRLAPVGARQVARPAQRLARRRPAPRRTRPASSAAAPSTSQAASAAPTGASIEPPVCSDQASAAERHRRARAAPQSGCMARARLPRFQGRAAKSGRIDRERHHEGREGEVEERRADRDLAPGQHLGEERPHRAEEDDEGGDDEQQVVDDEPALAADQWRRRRPSAASARARRRASASRR